MSITKSDATISFTSPERLAVKYWAFCDAAGGSGADSYGFAIAHQEKDRIVVDVVREFRPPA